MITCPCCGNKFQHDLETGCTGCGARRVGPPLARPEIELPSYGRALAVGAGGILLLLAFASSTVAALVEDKPLSFGFWNGIAAAETAAWRLRWLAPPVALVLSWLSWRVGQQVRREPLRFTGQRLARTGLVASAAIIAAVAVLIGVTVPERMRQNELAQNAADMAVVYATHRVLSDYRAKFGTYPSKPDDLLILPDPDGSVAALRTSMKSEIGEISYTPVANLAAAEIPASNSKSGRRRVSTVRVRGVALKPNTDDLPGEGVSLTNYELILPGKDKTFGTPDDLRIRDGMLVASPSPSEKNPRASSNISTREP